MRGAEKDLGTQNSSVYRRAGDKEMDQVLLFSEIKWLKS
jgi:hypothetical protein